MADRTTLPSQPVFPEPVAIHLHERDLPEDVSFGDAVAVDTETLGLGLYRDRLCLVQISGGDGVCHLVRIHPDQIGAGLVEEGGEDAAPAPRLKALFEAPEVTKIFHYARFDVAKLLVDLNILCAPVYCTKIASRLARTYTSGHGLKEVTRELVGIELDKQQQSSDWAAADLSDEQLRYAANDVLHLHAIKQKLDMMLAREGRTGLAEACFGFLQHRAELDLAGWPETDIFAH